MKRLHLLVCCLSSLITSCFALGPDYQRPTIVPPETYRSQIGTAEATSFADLPWWQVFRDDALSELIGETLNNNYDLQVAATRVEQARALVGVARAEFFPQLGYEGGIGRAHQAGQFF